jgi:hypothetical protein
LCGIAGFYFHDPENCPLTAISIEKLISELFLGIEHRGFDATGIAAVGAASGALHIEKADTEASNFNWWRSNLPETPRSVLLHTRFATKGTPMNLENNHPIRYNNIVVTHNGHINNDDELFSEECLSRNAEVDSEAIAAVFDKYGIDKAHIPLGKFDGNMAVAVADLRKPNTLVLAKGQSSPLYYYNAKEGIMWASTESTLIEASEKALGLSLESKDIEQLRYGKLLLIEDGEVDTLEFKPYRKTYSPLVPASHYYTDQAWGGQVTETEDEEDSELEVESYSSWHSRFFGRLKGIKKEDKKEEEVVEETTLGSEDQAYHDTDLAHIEFWENESHPMAYSISTASGKRFLFKECDSCNKAFQTTLLTVVENGFILCSYCIEDFDIEQEINPGDDNPAVVHEVTIELVAEKFKTNPDFVHWLLFDSDDGDIEDGDSHLISLYIQFQEEYDKVYKELTDNPFGNAVTLARLATEKEDEEEEDELIGCGVKVFEEDTAAIEGVI